MKFAPRNMRRHHREAGVVHGSPRCEPLEGRRLFAGGLDWSTFLGGSGRDGIRDVAAVPDGSGDVVVTGMTTSEDFPATAGTRPPPNEDGFPADVPYVARLSGDGSRLVYATYLPDGISVSHVAVAPDGSPVVVGETRSTGFASTPGAFQSVPEPDGTDAVVLKLDPAGANIVFASRIGGSDSETVSGVGIDAAGGVVVAGYTPSADLPTTPGAYDRTINQRVIGGETETTTDAFVSRLSPDGTQLTYSTFLGGEGDDRANAVTVDTLGFVTLVGVTNAAGERERDDGTIEFLGRPFPTTNDAFQRRFQGQEDAFVARLKPDGGGAADLRYASILGSVGEDIAWSVAHDPNDPLKVVLTSQTDGWNFPTTPGVLQRTRIHPDLEGDPDLAVSAFRFGAASSGRLEWSTLHGQISAYLSEADVAFDNAGNVVLVGVSERYDFGGQNDRPTTDGAYDRTPDDSAVFLSRLSGDGRQLLYATNVDFPGNIPYLAAVGDDSVVVVTTTSSDSFPTTPGAFDTTLNEPDEFSQTPSDGLAAKFTLAPIDPSDATGPAAPALAAPADGAQLQSRNPDGSASIVTFDWGDATDPSGVRLYELEVGHNAEFVQQGETDQGARTLVRSEASEAQVNMAELRDGRVYHWRVRALDGANNFGPWSEPRSFVLGDAGEPRLAAAVLTPDGAPAGTPVQGKVLLQGVAPAGGTTVTLTPSDRRLLSVPATVTVPEGASSATFPVTARAVAVSTPVWVEAELGDDRTAPVLWIDPGGTAAAAKLKSLTLKSSSVSGGTKTLGTVTLTAPAPEGGYRLKLASDKAGVAGVPASVLVPGGRTSATFEVMTKPVSSTKQVRITTSLGAAQRRATLTVRPRSAGTTYQAESPSRGGAVVSAAHRGYTGSGYLDFVNARGDYAEFRVNAAAAGTYTLKFRYANGGGSRRAMGLSVNGATQSGGVGFASTGSWSNWREADVIVRLTAGVNRIRLIATGQSGPNLDALTVLS